MSYTTEITFTVPAEIAAEMTHKSPDIYFDVFGDVRLRVNGYPKIGEWRVTAG